MLRDRDGAWQPTAPMPEGRLAAAGGFVDGTMVMVGGWELKFSQRTTDPLPALVHALYTG